MKTLEKNTLPPEPFFPKKEMQNITDSDLEKSDILFSTGVGINQVEETPVRLATYLLPMIAFLQKHKNSLGQLYFADQAAIKLGQNSEIVKRNTDAIERFINAFLIEFFEDVKDDFVISHEKNDKNPERQNLLNELISILKQSGDTSILNFANKRINGSKSIDTPLGYIAEHSLFMRDPITENDDLFLIDNPKQIDLLVMIGGPAEKLFCKARNIICEAREKIEKDFERKQVITDIGRRPPYYRFANEPILEENLSEECVQTFLKGLNKELVKDYIFLLASLSKEKDFTIIKRRKKLNQGDLEILQNGYESLRTFVKNL